MSFLARMLPLLVVAGLGLGLAACGTRDRSYYTLGAGILIDTVLAVDVAWMKGSYERADSDFEYFESVETSALIVEATYRF